MLVLIYTPTSHVVEILSLDQIISPTFGTVRPFNFCQLRGCKTVSQWNLICVVLTTENAGYFFVCTLATHIFLSVKCLLVSFAYSPRIVCGLSLVGA